MEALCQLTRARSFDADGCGDIAPAHRPSPRPPSPRPPLRDRLWLILIFALVPFALSLGSTDLRAQKAAPERHRIRMESAVREMNGDARMKKMSQQQQQDLVDFVAGNMLFVAFHELGHAIIGQLHLPVLGREEDAADAFATQALLDLDTEFSVNVLVQAARGWFLMDRRDRKLGDEPDFYDAHGLDQQRAFVIVCLMVGSDAQQFRELADWVQLPEDRRKSCRGDYENAKYSFDEVLKPHLRSSDRPKPAVTVAYQPASAKLDRYLRSFRSIGFLETLADYISDRYVLPRPIMLVMKSCGDTNAWWDPDTLTETLCYEMAEDFLELYSGYTEKPTSQKKMGLNELIARNVKRIRLEHKMSMGSLATDSGMPATWVARMERGLESTTVEQLQKLALALKVEAAEFFTQPRQAAAEAKPRSRK